MTQDPTIGRIVRYVIPARCYRAGEVRPAIITRAHTPVTAEIHPGMSNLFIFRDGPNDLNGPAVGVSEWVGSVMYDPDGAPGTWHWPGDLDAGEAGPEL